MKNFKSFLTESARPNLHIEHIEEEVFNKGVIGTKTAIAFLKDFCNFLEGTEHKVRPSIKWDGRPAIICGQHPETNKFFVGTKSVFNVGIPKINYTTEDIDKNYADKPDLAKRLKIVLKELSGLQIEGVVQGDLLFVKEDLRLIAHNHTQYVAFSPNTITYAIPAQSALGKSLIESSVGMSFHTQFTGSTLNTLHPTQTPPTVKGTPHVAVLKTALSNSTKISKEDINKLKARLDAIMTQVESIDATTLDTIGANPAYQRLLKQYVNSRIVLGESISSDEHYLNNLFEFAETHSKKFVGYFLENRAQIKQVFELVESINSIKTTILQKITSIQEMQMFVESNHMFSETSIEGVVLTNPLGKSLKLVNRLEFSHKNFLKNKNLI